MTDISLEALLDEIWLERGDDSDGCATTEELVQKTGVSANTVRKRLKALAREGRLENRQVRRTSILNGQPYHCSAYRLKQD